MNWHKASEWLPKKSMYYLCITQDEDGSTDDFAIVIPFSVKHQRFNARDNYEPELAEELSMAVSYWMELPEHPESKWYF